MKKLKITMILFLIFFSANCYADDISVKIDDSYIEFGYYRTKESYMKEWRAHNFVHALIPFGSIGERTASVDLNHDEEDDDFSWIYGFFW